MSTFSELDTLKYIAIYTREQIDHAQEQISGNPKMTTELEDALEPARDVLDKISDVIAEHLLEHVDSLEDRNRYSDGRPIWTAVDLPEEGYTFSYLWPPDPDQQPSPGHDTQLPSGRIATVSFHLPSEIRVEYSGWWKPTDVTPTRGRRHLHSVRRD